MSRSVALQATPFPSQVCGSTEDVFLPSSNLEYLNESVRPSFLGGSRLALQITVT